MKSTNATVRMKLAHSLLLLAVAGWAAIPALAQPPAPPEAAGATFPPDAPGLTDPFDGPADPGFPPGMGPGRGFGPGMGPRPGFGPGSGPQFGMGPGMGHGLTALLGGRLGHWSAQGLLRPEVQERLGLSAEQIERIKSTDYEVQSQLIARNAELEQTQLELRRLTDTEQIDRIAVMSQIDKVGELRTEIQKLDTGRLLDLREVLTPEQREQARALIQDRVEERRAGLRQFMANRRGGPGPGFAGADGNWRRRAAQRREAIRGTVTPPPSAAPAQ